MSDSSGEPGIMSPEALAQGRQWAATWKKAGQLLEKLRREEIRTLDTYEAISNLTGPIDFTQEPFRPQPTSGLIKQQAWFKKLRR